MEQFTKTLDLTLRNPPPKVFWCSGLRVLWPNVESLTMRGYFGIGIEGVSKPINVGNLVRSAHAFGASFVFTVAANYDVSDSASDTSDTPSEVPFYPFDNIESLRIPEGCALVGIEIDDRAINLPSFRHPRRAAYVLGMERVGLSTDMIKCCDHFHLLFYLSDYFFYELFVCFKHNYKSENILYFTWRTIYTINTEVPF